MNEDDLNNFIGEQLSSGVEPDALAAALLEASLAITSHFIGHERAIAVARTGIDICEGIHKDEASGAKPH